MIVGGVNRQSGGQKILNLILLLLGLFLIYGVQSIVVPQSTTSPGPDPCQGKDLDISNHASSVVYREESYGSTQTNYSAEYYDHNGSLVAHITVAHDPTIRAADFGTNISVWTAEQFRGRGVATAAVANTVNWFRDKVAGSPSIAFNNVNVDRGYEYQCLRSIFDWSGTQKNFFLDGIYGDGSYMR